MENLLLGALKGKARELHLVSHDISELPSLIGKLNFLTKMDLKLNHLMDLPPEFSKLGLLEQLNIAKNQFSSLPKVLSSLRHLCVLHAFENQISVIPPEIIEKMTNLTFLNLNHNQIEILPPEIGSLYHLQVLSISHNRISLLPKQLCTLRRLRELNVSSNRLQDLPEELVNLRRLKSLQLQKNKLRRLPEGMSRMHKLKVLDVAANRIQLFPCDLPLMKIKEFYAEENDFIARIGIVVVKEDDLPSLRELAARRILAEGKNRRSIIHYFLQEYPQVKTLLSRAHRCAVCGQFFLKLYAMCVEFVDAHKILSTSNGTGVIPTLAFLCSYKCFTAPGRNFFSAEAVAQI